jgi:outer membrane receptor protein involved in Fe transport
MKNSVLENLKKRPLVHAVAFALAANSVSVFAQEATDTEAETDKEEEKIVITGSRIRSGGFDEARPVDIIMSDTAITQGIGDLGALLRNSTVASGSQQVTAASSTAFVQDGGTGTQTLSLRGLGANRTLVLLNGRRAGPAGTRGGVSSFDFNVLPISLVERVEILKDGASSVYGSDAVAGVVNIITKKGDGGDIDVSYSQPSESGGESFRISGSYGSTFERGSFRVTADYQKRVELAQGDRDYFSCPEEYIFDQDTGERADLIDPRTGNPRCNDSIWGHVWLYDYQGTDENGFGLGNVPTNRFTLAQYDYDGDLAQHVPGIASDPSNPGYLTAPADWYLVNYDRRSDAVTNADHPFQDETSLIPEIEIASVFAQADYEISDNMMAYSELLISRRKSEANGYRQYYSYLYNGNFDFANGIGEGNGNPLSEGWGGANWISPTPITDHSDSGQTVDYVRFVAGLTGDIGDWYYDISYQNSRSEGEYRNDIIFNDSIRDQNFLNGPCEGTPTSVRGVPCVDVPWLDPELMRGNVSDEVRAFLFGQDVGNTLYKQSTLEAFVSGDLFELPAGPVGAVFGVSYQKDEIDDVPGENSRVGNAWNQSSAGITAGKDNTTAVFTELKIPLLEDAFLAQTLELELSGRYTDVDSYGDGTTYKVGLNWALTEAWRVRASKGTSFRSPALFELYLANQTGSLRQSQVDPCVRWGTQLDRGAITQNLADNCAADGIADDYSGGAISATTIRGGGAGVLEAETSTSKTIGLVWTPEFADLSISIDHFDFEINDEVTILGGGNIVSQCYNSEFFGSEPLCDQFDRNPLDNRIETIRDQYINIAKQNNSGYDVALRYAVDVEGGNLVFSTQHTFQEESSRAIFADNTIDTNGEFGDPKHVASYNLSYDKNDWSLNWNINYVGAVSNMPSYERNNGVTDWTTQIEHGSLETETFDIVLSSDSVMYHAFSFTYNLPDTGLVATVGVANAFDEAPPRVTTLNFGEVNSIGNSAFYSQYDWLGRRFFLNAKYEF